MDVNDEEVAALLARSQECLAAGYANASAGRWNRAASDLYYAVFDAGRAVLLRRGLEARSHGQVRAEFNRLLVRSGLLTREEARLYGQLFDLRQLGDYAPTRSLQKEDVEPFLDAVSSLVGRLRSLA